MKNLFKCDYCDFVSEDKNECQEHEKTHRKEISCFKEYKTESLACTMSILEIVDTCELVFTWKPEENGRTMSSTYTVVTSDLLNAIEPKEEVNENDQ
jgi:uncharacterized protein YndB with AHSA1/START domain